MGGNPMAVVSVAIAVPVVAIKKQENFSEI